MAANSRRPLDRAIVAKLSDARERLHALVTRAAAAAAHEHAWPQDLNAPSPSAEEPRRG
jgi:hypothetical protein